MIRPPSSVGGDGGASWRLKALKRAQEQADREGRKLEQVVEERWGSLGQLTLSAVSHTAVPARARKRGRVEEDQTQNERDIEMKNQTMHQCEKRIPIPLGPDFQAEVPEWTSVICGSDSKWNGTRIWPPEKVDNKFVIEREPIGKGRQDSCGCEKPNSVKCIRFHITERRIRVKRELGIAFYLWRFDRMGEDVELCWTKEEEKKFEAIVKSNPSFLGKCFWDEIIKSFPSKRRRDIVSYYFNVFLIRRRAHQNRFTLNNIDSDDDDDDDDESECGVAPNISRCGPSKSPCSLLYPAKNSRKSRLVQCARYPPGPSKPVQLGLGLGKNFRIQNLNKSEHSQI